MTVIEIILCCNLVVSLYLAWRVYLIEEDLDELESFSVQSIINLAKQMENMQYEQRKRNQDTRRGHERGDQG